MKCQPTRRGRSGNKPSEKEPPDSLFFEKELYSKGVRLIAGIDEAGRGPLAGAVVAAAVILPIDLRMEGLRDSKKLTQKRREHFFDEILESAVSYGIGVVSPDEIDRINILQASLKAMKIAVEGLSVVPDYLLIDGNIGIDHHLPQLPLIGGDDRSQTIAAASVLAKVTRDRMMCELELDYPSFSFSTHKGYGTKRHYEEIFRHGPTPIHRRTFLKNLACHALTQGG